MPELTIPSPGEERPRRKRRTPNELDRLITGIQSQRGISKPDAMEHVANMVGYASDTLYRWMLDRSTPPCEVAQKMLVLGRSEANLDRNWGRALLTHIFELDPANAEKLVADVWGPERLSGILGALPERQHQILFGRDKEVKELLELLSPGVGTQIVVVEGAAGVGKTALVLEVAHRCREASEYGYATSWGHIFTCFIFVSAKQKILTAQGPLPQNLYPTRSTLSDILNGIGEVLRLDVKSLPPDQQEASIREGFRAHRSSLLIVDNLETIKDTEQAGVFKFLRRLPRGVKVVVTSREESGASEHAPVQLSGLLEEDALKYIQQQASLFEVNLDKKQAAELCRLTGCVPAAMRFAVNQLQGKSYLEVIQGLNRADGPYARFCFEGLASQLRSTSAHSCLMAIAMFPRRPTRQAVIQVAGLQMRPDDAEGGIAVLKRRHLISITTGSDQDRFGVAPVVQDRFGVDPVVREYALADLMGVPDFEREARERAVKWCSGQAELASEAFTSDFGELKYDWENLLEILEWCRVNGGQYNVIKKFWASRRINDFATHFGYWEDLVRWRTIVKYEAETRSDPATVLRAERSIAWIMILRGREYYSDAARLLESVWSRWSNSEFTSSNCLYDKFEVANDMAFLLSKQGGKWGLMQEWVNKQESLLKAVEEERQTFGDPCWERVLLWDNQARYHYGMGRIAEADKLWKQVVTEIGGTEHSRFSLHALLGRAECALETKQLELGMRLANDGLELAKRIEHRRLIAEFHRVRALLARKMNREQEACLAVSMAKRQYTELAMRADALEMKRLREEWDCQTE